MRVLINGKYFTETNEPVRAYDLYGNVHIIKPVDFHLFNFTSFQKLVVDGLTITN
jgi:hypothetical protein